VSSVYSQSAIVLMHSLPVTLQRLRQTPPPRLPSWKAGVLAGWLLFWALVFSLTVCFK
jgi:hypothetical protein